MKTLFKTLSVFAPPGMFPEERERTARQSPREPAAFLALARAELDRSAPSRPPHPQPNSLVFTGRLKDWELISLFSEVLVRTLVEIVRWIDQIGVELADVQLRRPSLEDVFIELTGKSLRE